MKMEEFAKKYVKGFTDLPQPWQTEVVLILNGLPTMYSAEKRKVTRDAVKAQRKKIFKALGVEDGRDLIVKSFHVAVQNTR